jgi:hypothetical protein
MNIKRKRVRTKKNVSVSKPRPINDLATTPEKMAEIKVTKRITKAVKKGKLVGNSISPERSLAIIHNEKERKVPKATINIFPNWKGKEIEGIKKIGRRKATANIM